MGTFFLGLVFFSYQGGPIVVAGFLSVFCIVDFSYHMKNRPAFLKALGVGLVFTAAYLWFYFQVDFSPFARLAAVDSYWAKANLDLVLKFETFILNIFKTLDPRVWFLEVSDNPRHFVLGYPRVNTFLFVFYLAGLLSIIWNFKRPEYRFPLVLLVITSFPSAIAGISPTRSLMIFVPLVMIIFFGIFAMFDVIERVKAKWLEKIAVVVAGFGSVVLTLLLLGHSLNFAMANATDYGLYGLQYGGEKVFKLAKELMLKNPDKKVFISGSWGNQIDSLRQYYFRRGEPVFVIHPDILRYGLIEEFENQIFILTEDEYQSFSDSKTIQFTEIFDTIMYPNGRPGFRAVRVQFKSDARMQLALEKVVRRVPKEEFVLTNKGSLKLIYSQLDIGDIEHILDGDRHTFVRGRSDNPFVVQVQPQGPTRFRGLDIAFDHHKGRPVGISVFIKKDQKSQWVPWLDKIQSVDQTDPKLSFDMPKFPIHGLKIEARILDLVTAESIHFHLHEITLKTESGPVRLIRK